MPSSSDYYTRWKMARAAAGSNPAANQRLYAWGVNEREESKQESSNMKYLGAEEDDSF